MTSIRFIIATRQREQILVQTLRCLQRVMPAHCDHELVVIDNGCSGSVATAIDVAGLHGVHIQVIEPPENLGPCGKQLGLEDAASDLCVLLDDDARPAPGSIERMIELFDADPQLAAAGFVPHLPDGSIESCALPDVFVGCGVGLRTTAVREVGGLDAWFFMEAEEYDLTFRLINAGWKCGVFEELIVDHLKSPVARMQRRTLLLDARNNAYLAVRYLPAQLRRMYMLDWANRYRWMLDSQGDERGVATAWLEGVTRGLHTRTANSNHALSPGAFEQLFRWNEIHERMVKLAERGITRIALAGLGKNILPFLNGAWHANLHVAAVIDDRPFAAGRHYHGVLVVPTEDRIEDAAVDAIVISETSPARTRTMLKTLDTANQTVVGWFGDFAPTLALT